MRVVDTDYLVVGAGAAGMAFADSLIAGGDANVVMVERRHRPGGHWNDAYPFVRLHQASANYGVNSRILGTNSIDQTGSNAGFYERATGVEICDYFQKVLDEVLLPSGQVRFFGMCDYVGNWVDDHVFTSRLTDAHTKVRVRRRIVDTTYLEVSVPATHTPTFTVDADVPFFPVGKLAALAGAPTGYNILGAGKTAMDACAWLLENGVEPDKICWVRPREPWIIDCGQFEPLKKITSTLETFSLNIETLAQAKSLDHLWRSLEERQLLFRLDPSATPNMFRAPVLNSVERRALEEIKRVVRLGRVRHLGRNCMILDQGEVATEHGEVFVDCTASGIRSRPGRPIFEPGRITIQSLIGGYTTYHAALLGFIESTDRADTEKNRLCPPLSPPTYPVGWIEMYEAMLRNSPVHAAEPDVSAWQESSRLNLTGGMGNYMDDPRIHSALARLETNTEMALKNAEKLLTESRRGY